MIWFRIFDDEMVRKREDWSLRKWDEIRHSRFLAFLIHDGTELRIDYTIVLANGPTKKFQVI